MSLLTVRELNGPNCENDGHERIHRYTRADLLAMRYEEYGRQRPSCANRTELQTLNFWRVGGLPSNITSSSVSSSSYGIKSSIQTEADNNCSLNNGSRRTLRNRERANNYYQRFVASDQIGEDIQQNLLPTTSNINTPYKSSTIDHRSISSSHLMPAFAKRRLAATTTTTSSTDANDLLNEKSETLSNSGDDIQDSGEPNRPPTQTQTQINIELKCSVRPPVDLLISPVRKIAGSAEWERSNPQDYEQLESSPSSTFSSSRHGNFPVNMPEKRIGSGRLLPRDDSWEYNKNKNKDADTPIVTLGKDRERLQHGINSTNIHQGQRAERTIGGGRHMERPPNANENPMDRRNNERRGAGGGGSDMREQYDSKRTGQGNRRTSNKDKFNYGDSGGGQNRGRRSNMYQTYDRREEPEWFSAGPTSQLETIDLHGFDDVENNEDRSEFEAEAEKVVALKSNKVESVGSGSVSGSRRSSNLNIADQFANENDDKNTINKQSSDEVRTKNMQVEFNFDAFLNLDPMDHTLMGNDCEVQGETTGTSRFSRWFGAKTNPNNPNIDDMPDSNILDTHGFPSVKDLEAQMTKVNLRNESSHEFSNTIASALPLQKNQKEKPVSRDTEAFKKLLQQLGTQHKAQHTTELLQLAVKSAEHNTNRSYVIGSPHHLATINNPQMNDDDLQKTIYHQNIIHSERMQNRNNEASAHPFQLSSIFSPNVNVHDPNKANVMSMHNQKRIEIQHLLQRVSRGEVSLEFLEQELGNPNAPADSKEIIVTVLRECSNMSALSNSGRIPAQQKLTYQPNLNDISLHNLGSNQSSFHQNVCPNVSEDLSTQNTPTQGISHNIRHTNSPTPLAFTPTSVLRKMTADKEATPSQNSVGNQQYQQYQFSSHQHHQNKHIQQGGAAHNMANTTQPTAALNLQPRMILGGNYSMQHQFNANSPQVSPKSLPQQMTQSRSQQMKWPSTANAHGIKSMGRPILKGPMNSVSQPIQNAAFAPKMELQHMHQQRLKSLQATESVLSNDHLHSTPLQNYPFTDGVGVSQIHHHYAPQPHAPHRHRMQSIHLGEHRQVSLSGVPSGGVDGSESGNVAGRNNNLGAINYHRDGRLSPATNQLSQWFSPELLARASAGKLPLLNMNQALSLEEFERSIQHSSAAVHN